MLINMIFGTVGGLGMFLFGMHLMSDGLKKVAEQKLRNILEALTRHRVAAVAVGALVTALIQSSSATTIMTVGFVNAGLLTLKQALCVVLGANVGTTFTAWLVSAFGIGAFKITTYALPAIGVGFLIGVTGKTQRVKSIGNILLGRPSARQHKGTVCPYLAREIPDSGCSGRYRNYRNAAEQFRFNYDSPGTCIAGGFRD